MKILEKFGKLTTFIQLMILIIIDTILISTWIYWFKPDESGSILVLFLPFAIFILCVFINNLISLVDNTHKKILKINSFIAPLVFIILFSSWFHFDLDDWVFHKYYYFSKDNINYKIIMYKQSDGCEIEYYTGVERKNKQYNTLKSKDTLFLTGDSSKIYIFNDTIIGFPEKSDKIEIFD